MTVLPLSLYVFVSLAILTALLYAFGWEQIYLFGADKTGQYKKERDAIERLRPSIKLWLVWNILVNSLGGFIGWIMMYVLLDIQLGWFQKNIELQMSHLILFMLAFTGIIGRLPDLVTSFIVGTRKIPEGIGELLKASSR